jgi:hypothetical protein
VTRWSTSRSRGVSDSSRFADHVAPRQHAAAARVELERLVDAVEQVLVAERLLDEVDRAGLHRLDRHRHVAVAGDEDDRQDRVALVELDLQFETAHAGHADVEHQAPRPVVALGVEELLTGFEHLHGQPDRLEQHAQGIADRCVVVDDEYRGSDLFDHSVVSPLGAGETGSVK